MNNRFVTNSLSAYDLLNKKKALKKELLQKGNLFLEKRIAVLGGSTTAEVVDQLELFLLARGIQPTFYQSEYNRFYEEALFPSKELLDFKPDLIYIHTSVMNISSFPSISDSIEAVDALLAEQLNYFQAVWSGIARHFKCPIVQNNVDLFWNRPLGNLDGIDYRGKTRFINRLNELFVQAAEKNTQLHLHDIHYLSARIGIDKWFSPRHWYLYKYAMDLDVIPEFAHHLSAVISSLWGLGKKALVLDLDNTLWGGVIGDDGVEGIQVGFSSAEAEAHADLQEYAAQLRERGILLAAASKNDEANALAGLMHDETRLKREDFSSFKANWDAKPENLTAIASDLNIGMDSFVFLDDNPAERELMRAQLPDVAVPEVGDDISDYVRCLDQAALFETFSVSDEDLNRSGQYQHNMVRKQQAALYDTYDEYLEALQMTARIEPFSSIYIDRITQLINKTNQFNLTTYRCSESEVEAMMQDSMRICLHGRLRDKFGDNGIISVISGKIKDDILQVDLWLMSCRVLKRGMEQAMFEQLYLQAQKKGVTRMEGFYRPSSKNAMVENLYESFGFVKGEISEQGVVWGLAMEDYSWEKVKHFIKVSNE